LGSEISHANAKNGLHRELLFIKWQMEHCFMQLLASYQYNSSLYRRELT